MATVTRIAAALILLASPVYAQEPTLKLPVEARPVAARISDYAVVSAATIRLYEAWHDEDRKGALIEAGCEAAVTAGSVELMKRAFGRERPDKSDRYSFPSGHSGMAFAMGGFRFAVPVAGLRVLSAKHFWTDTLGGILTAYAATQVCR